MAMMKMKVCVYVLIAVAHAACKSLVSLSDTTCAAPEDVRRSRSGLSLHSRSQRCQRRIVL